MSFVACATNTGPTVNHIGLCCLNRASTYSSYTPAITFSAWGAYCGAELNHIGAIACQQKQIEKEITPTWLQQILWTALKIPFFIIVLGVFKNRWLWSICSLNLQIQCCRTYGFFSGQGDAGLHTPTYLYIGKLMHFERF